MFYKVRQEEHGLKFHDGEKRGFWAGIGMIFGVVYLFRFVELSNGKNKNPCLLVSFLFKGWKKDVPMTTRSHFFKSVLYSPSQYKPRWWFHFSLIFTPIWGRFPFWLIFQMGWNHQLYRKWFLAESHWIRCHGKTLTIKCFCFRNFWAASRVLGKLLVEKIPLLGCPRKLLHMVSKWVIQ